MTNKTLIIAEAGVNHNGSLDMAKELIDVAAQSGADLVKFQTFKAKKLVDKKAKMADYQVKNTGVSESQLAMLQRLELSIDDHFQLLEHCQKRNIEFFSTAFDDDSLNFLVNDMTMSRLKLPSGELTNAPALLSHARTGLDLIISTGMATMDEIVQALKFIAFGLVAPKDQMPTEAELERIYQLEQTKALLREKVTILHCTSEYPAPWNDIHLNAMGLLRDTFSLPVGYSDHSEGIHIPIAAVSLGATVIEKHFTLSRDLPGPDHKASIEPDELSQMVRCIRQTEQALGQAVKTPNETEQKTKLLVRKSLGANVDMRKGEIFTEQNLTTLRPGTGMSTSLYWDMLGKPASKDYEAGELIDEQ